MNKNQVVELMKQSKTDLINCVLEYQKINYPTRTTEVEKCRRDIGHVYDAYIFDIDQSTTWQTSYIGSRFWKNGKRQIVSYNVEIDIHQRLINELIEVFVTNSVDQSYVDKIQQLHGILSTSIINGPNAESKQYPSFTPDLIQNIATARYNYKPLTGTVKEEDVEKIIRAASGTTPCLSNEYNYRVELIPDRFKPILLEKTANFSTAAVEAGKPGYAVDKNYQYLAPVLLCWCLKESAVRTDREEFAGPMTKRDPNLLNIGISLWHTVMVALSLGYKTSFINLTDWKKTVAKEILGLQDPDPDLRFVNRDGPQEYYPIVFLAIGSQGEINGNTRSEKYKDIVNKLILN